LTNLGWLEAVKLGISTLTLVSIIIAYLSYRANQNKSNDDRVREKDKELVVQVQKSLQWAYDVLTEDSKNVPPQPDRLNWLTTARHLLRAQTIADQISSETYKTVYAEIEEYWRHRFYKALSHISLRDRAYFTKKDNPGWPENIEISSALVIVSFSSWKKDAPDPTDSVDRENLIKNSGGLKGGYAGRGLEAYIALFEEIKAQRIASQNGAPSLNGRNEF